MSRITRQEYHARQELRSKTTVTTTDPNEIEQRVIGARDAIDRQMDDAEDYLAVHIVNRVEDMPLKTMAKAAKLLAEGQGFSFIRPDVIEGAAEPEQGAIETGEK